MKPVYLFPVKRKLRCLFVLPCDSPPQQNRCFLPTSVPCFEELQHVVASGALSALLFEVLLREMQICLLHPHRIWKQTRPPFLSFSVPSIIVPPGSVFLLSFSVPFVIGPGIVLSSFFLCTRHHRARNRVFLLFFLKKASCQPLPSQLFLLHGMQARAVYF